MAYGTLNEMKLKIQESVLITLSNDVAGAVVVDTAKISEAIDAADREIDSYVSSGGYEVPLSPVPPLVTDLSSRMAIWNLHKRKYFNNEQWADDYKKCLRTLLLISEGKLKLRPTSVPETASEPLGYASESRHKKFTHHKVWEHF